MKHVHFEELCAAASIGQATAEELAQLEQHTSECDACRRAYFDYLNVASQEFAAPKQAPSLSSRDLEESLNSELFTRRFFDRAQREGIIFSREVEEKVKSPAPIEIVLPRRRLSQTPMMATAAAVVFAVITSGGYFYWKHSLTVAPIASRQQRSEISDIRTPATVDDTHIRELTAENSKLELQIDRLRGELRNRTNELTANEADLKAKSQDRLRLASDRDALSTKLEQMGHELEKAESGATTLQQEANAQSQRADRTESRLVASQIKLHELEEQLKEESAALDQYGQMLSAGHDVTDLMGARNLHIVDVVDTDSRGKTRPAFGRIFFTEGKSLIFYAYDLNEQKIQKANYEYQVWAKKEGQNQHAQRLGIFYSDDKAQRRWVFKCDDAKILREIDSVFVTLGRPDSDPSHPEGSSLMYAYLRGQPNHP